MKFLIDAGMNIFVMINYSLYNNKIINFRFINFIIGLQMADYTCVNINDQTFNESKSFDRCNVINCTFNTKCYFDRCNIIECTNIDNCECVKSNIIDHMTIDDLTDAEDSQNE